MESDTLNLKALFQGDVRYIIPTFQRPFVWNQDDQLDPLWDDARNIAERYLAELDRLGDDLRAENKQGTGAFSRSCCAAATANSYRRYRTTACGRRPATF